MELLKEQLAQEVVDRCSLVSGAGARARCARDLRRRVTFVVGRAVAEGEAQEMKQATGQAQEMKQATARYHLARMLVNMPMCDAVR